MFLLVLSRSFRGEERSFLAEKAPSRWASGYKVELWRLLIKVKLKVAQSCPTLCGSMDWNSPGKNTGMGSHSFLQGIVPIQGSNPGLLHCKQILYQLSHKRSPRIGQWAAYPFFSRSFQPRNQNRVFCIAGRFITNWAILNIIKV